MKTFSINESLKFGWHKTKKNFSKVVTVLLILIFLNLATHFLSDALAHSDRIQDSIVYLCTEFGFLLIEIVVGINLIKQGLIIVRGGEAHLRKLLDYPEAFWKYILGQLCAGAIIFAGFLLLIIPGIFAALILCFNKLVLVDLKLSPVEALIKSHELSKGNLWRLFVFFLTLVVLNLAGALLLGLGLIVTLPISFFAFLHLYDLRSKHPIG